MSPTFGPRRESRVFIFGVPVEARCAAGGRIQQFDIKNNFSTISKMAPKDYDDRKDRDRDRGGM